MTDRNFYSDHRVRAEMLDRPRFIEERGRPYLVVEVCDDDGYERELRLPARFEVCGTCGGRGSHVNPAIDADGISPEEFAEDPDFMEDYLSGSFDVPCYACGGRRVEPVVNDDIADSDERRLYYEDLRARQTTAAQLAAERALGT